MIASLDTFYANSRSLAEVHEDACKLLMGRAELVDQFIATIGRLYLRADNNTL
jgi:hypothetical protein